MQLEAARVGRQDDAADPAGTGRRRHGRRQRRRRSAKSCVASVDEDDAKKDVRMATIVAHRFSTPLRPGEWCGDGCRGVGHRSSSGRDRVVAPTARLATMLPPPHHVTTPQRRRAARPLAPRPPSPLAATRPHAATTPRRHHAAAPPRRQTAGYLFVAMALSRAAHAAVL